MCYYYYFLTIPLIQLAEPLQITEASVFIERISRVEILISFKVVTFKFFRTDVSAGELVVVFQKSSKSPKDLLTLMT